MRTGRVGWAEQGWLAGYNSECIHILLSQLPGRTVSAGSGTNEATAGAQLWQLRVSVAAAAAASAPPPPSPDGDGD